MITIFSVALLCFLFWLKSQFENSRFRLLTLIRLSLKTQPLLREPLQYSILSYQWGILFGISEVVLCLLLIVDAFCMSQDVHHLASWLQIPAEGSSLEHIYTRNRSYSSTLLHPCKPYSSFLPPSCRSNQTSWPAKTTEVNVRWRRFWRRTCR